MFEDLRVVVPSRQEGNRSYATHVGKDDPLMFVVVEHWESAAAGDHRLESGYFKALRAAGDGGTTAPRYRPAWGRQGLRKWLP